MASPVIKQNVGNDLSKDDFSVCFYQKREDQSTRIKATRKFKNTLSGFKAFDKWVAKHQCDELPVYITIEATGVYHEQLVHFLHDQKRYRISVVLPNKSKAFAKSLNVKTKTDEVDAKILGQMGLERELEQWQPISQSLRQIKQLTRERINLLDEKVALSNKIHAQNHAYAPSREVIKRLKQRLKLIEQQIKQVEKQLNQCIDKDPMLKERIDKIWLVKGLGIITVVSVIAETAGFDLFTSQSQVASYAGYDIVQRESGSSIKGKTRISKKGNRFIRRALYFPAISVVKYEPQFKQLYERITERTSIKMKGLVAVQRKLLMLSYTLFKKNEAYDPQFAQKQQKISRQDTSPAYTG